jgi:hypothetical protein
MTSSVAFSNYANVSVSDPNDPGVARSNYNIKHRFTLLANYHKALFGDNETKFTLYGRMNEGRPFSPVYTNGGDLFGDTLDFRHLLYVPTGPSDPNVEFGPVFWRRPRRSPIGSGSWTTVACWHSTPPTR